MINELKDKALKAYEQTYDETLNAYRTEGRLNTLQLSHEAAIESVIVAVYEYKASTRNPITEMCYPRDIDAHEFLADIERSIEEFRANMVNLKKDKEKRLAEDWMAYYTDWMEMVK